MEKKEINFNKSISIIIPLHNKEATILLTLDKLRSDLKNVHYEIVIIENGSSDNSYSVTKNWCNNNSDVKTKLIKSEIGLGNAIKEGIKNSNNEYVWTVSPDMQFGVSDFISFKENYNSEISVYVGSRLHKNSKVVRSGSRKYISMVFNFLKKLIINSEIKDTMGSFIAKTIFLKKYCFIPVTTKFFYITELITIFEQNNHGILEIPVETFTEIDLHSKNASTVNFFTTPFEIFINLIMLRLRLKKIKLN